MQHANQTFRDEQIPLDGNQFEKCRFERCTLVYAGGDAPVFAGCSFDDLPRIAFIMQAGNTIEMLRSLLHSPFAKIAEDTISDLRNNTLRRLPPELTDG